MGARGCTRSTAAPAVRTYGTRAHIYTACAMQALDRRLARLLHAVCDACEGQDPIPVGAVGQITTGRYMYRYMDVRYDMAGSRRRGARGSASVASHSSTTMQLRSREQIAAPQMHRITAASLLVQL
jgi:hypothetical protein